LSYKVSKYHPIQKIISLVFSLIVSISVFCQKTELDSLDIIRKRKIVTVTSLSSLAAGSLIGLNELWYKDYPRSSLQFINDNDQWLQMDKAGHMMTYYHLGKVGYESMRWSGFSENTSLYLGGSIGLIYLTGIELLDGHSAQWGFSWGDQLANFLGTSSFIAQQKIWKEQRINLKFSYSNTPLAMLNPDQLGRNFQQRVLKDYNGQTYLASINVSSFLASDAAFPSWMNVAFGYGAYGMTSAKNVVNDVNNFQRTREFYLSFDADLNRVRWPKKWMKITAQILSFIKLPSPALKMQSDGKVKLYALHF